MTRVGAIVRCDEGGLGTQCWEFHRHMKPDRTLVVLTDHRTRGHCDPARYSGPDVMTVPRLPDPPDIRAFVDGLDVVFSAETVYSPDFVPIAREHGCEVVVQANPELWDGEADGARVVLPTAWEAARVSHEQILPVPIALDRFAGRVRTEARVFYHPSSPAMADRNGTALVFAALRWVTEPIKVIVRGAGSRGEVARRSRSRDLPDNVELVEVQHRPGPYWEAYPPDADVLLMPRRYGGLSLPVQEAAALGMPAIMLDVVPARSWPHVALVPTTGSERMQTKGGLIDVHTGHPRALAAQIDLLAADGRAVEALSTRALEWAERLAWSEWVDRYRVVLGG